MTARALRSTSVAVLSALLLAGCAAAPSVPEATVIVAGIDPDDMTQITASGIVTGVAEDGGECRFTFWAEGGSASRLRTTGRAEGDRTLCGPVGESVGLLYDTVYEVELTYESPGAGPLTSGRVAMVLP